MENIRIEKRVEGIAEVRDESGRNGLRIVIELKKEADAQGILAYLLKKTDLQVAYNFNMVAIVNKTPRQLGLKAILDAYIAHQKEVVTFRSHYELEKAEDRAHVLEGLVKGAEPPGRDHRHDQGVEEPPGRAEQPRGPIRVLRASSGRDS